VHGAALSHRFTGKLDGDKMSGAIDMGEYMGAKWTATRHAFGRAQGGDVG
jgi:L-seryl-tRNA(Ser) seleniumtransferase